MEVTYEEALSGKETRAFRAALRTTLQHAVPGVNIRFVRIPETIGQLSVVIELAEGENPSVDLLSALTPIIERFATPKRDAKCRIQNCGETPVSTWHRWSLP